MAGMPTYYKPSQWRGRRLVYQAADPDEPKRETVKIISFSVGAVIVAGIIYLATLWSLSYAR
jgi:hypothetical protein